MLLEVVSRTSIRIDYKVQGSLVPKSADVAPEVAQLSSKGNKQHIDFPYGMPKECIDLHRICIFRSYTSLIEENRPPCDLDCVRNPANKNTRN